MRFFISFFVVCERVVGLPLALLPLSPPAGAATTELSVAVVQQWGGWAPTLA